MRVGRIFVSIVLLSGSLAAAQATQPTDQWPDVVSQLCTALTRDGQAEALAKLIPDDANIRPFDSNQGETRFRVAERAAHLTVAFQRTYSGVAGSVVTDLSSDVTENSVVPQALRKKLIPRDAANLKSADQIAQRWVARELAPDAGSFIAVLLLAEPANAQANADLPREPIFVLVKAHQVGDQIVVNQIRYGETSQALE